MTITPAAIFGPSVVAASAAAIYTVPMGISISDPEWVGHLIEAIEGLCPTPPTMIWLDTLARTFGAGDENSQKDMNAFVAGVDRLRDFAHHVGSSHG